MAFKVHQPIFSDNGGTSYNNDMVYITVVVASKANNQCNFARLPFPIYRNLFSYDDICHGIVTTFLESMKIPPTFFDGGGCNMVENLSRMLRTATLQHHRLHLCVVMMVFEGSCRYKILNSSQPFDAEQFPSSGFVELACEGGECSFPASWVEDEEDKCAICFEGYPSHKGADMLPCSHVFHQSCIMKWFQRSPTCPKCRFIMPYQLLP
ncbi:hypothetical protein TanjilG_24914 [Lupinus angustifolius]|uniref:RING-type domain-containing protein n=1 Tax=Lupinus angustifolius TaxID=3871 RepID=A0A4P1R0R2_LUPAN|nr:PREDICTED: uncharacterized protein LOC109363625 [Lupinus angustifolius]OIV98743.1 hypothetical protein TanjilG_24914 [Lupinus angustifolius]